MNYGKCLFNFSDEIEEIGGGAHKNILTYGEKRVS